MAKDLEKPRGLSAAEWAWYLQNPSSVPLDKESIKWMYQHRNDNIPPVLPDEIGSEQTWGANNRTTKVEKLNEDIIGPKNTPYESPLKRFLQLWTGQGDSHNQTSTLRPTEDEALKKKSKKKK